MYSMASFTVARFQGRCHAHFSWTLFSEGTEIILWCFDFSNKSRLSKFFVCNIETFSDSRREFIFSIPSFVTPFYKFDTGIRAMEPPLLFLRSSALVSRSYVSSLNDRLLDPYAKLSFDASAIKNVSYPSFAPDKAVSPTQIS